MDRTFLTRQQSQSTLHAVLVSEVLAGQANTSTQQTVIAPQLLKLSPSFTLRSIKQTNSDTMHTSTLTTPCTQPYVYLSNDHSPPHAVATLLHPVENQAQDDNLCSRWLPGDNVFV
jgi:hypothetical protein